LHKHVSPLDDVSTRGFMCLHVGQRSRSKVKSILHGLFGKRSL
jgi:hypothetical protein